VLNLGFILSNALAFGALKEGEICSWRDYKRGIG
jgi:hypothetical protein